jgi:hypothetical protein
MRLIAAIFAIASVASAAAPTCDAGPAQAVIAGTTLTLDGSASAVGDGSSLTYMWQVTSKPAGAPSPLWSSHTTAQPELRMIMAGSYTFNLRVRNAGDGATSRCSVTHTASTANGTGGVRVYRISTNVPEATSLRVTLRSPANVNIDQQTCAGQKCAVTVANDALGEHAVMTEQLDSGGNVIATSDWQPLKMTAVHTPPVDGETLFPHIKTFAVLYNPLSAAQAEFFANRLDLIIMKGINITSGSVGDPRTYNDKVKVVDYHDLSGYLTTEEAYDVIAHAEANGCDVEDYHLRSTIDHNYDIDWSQNHYFDAASAWGENMGTGQGGVYTCTSSCTGTGLTDETVDAYDTGTADVPIAGTIYLGYFRPHDMVKMLISTPRVGGSMTWSYWNGSTWASLTPVSDASSGMSVASSEVWLDMQLDIANMTDWTRTEICRPGLTQNVQSDLSPCHPKWWIRGVVSGASQTPVVSRIVGDPWTIDQSVMLTNDGGYADVTNSARSSTDSLRITVGSELYVGYYLKTKSVTSAIAACGPGLSNCGTTSVNVATARVGGSVAWQYWNGSTWASLSITDGTAGLTQTGLLTFAAPADWATTAVNGNTQYWFRAVVTGATTDPILNSVTNAQWTRLRGWDPTDPDIITCCGGIEYNPSPSVASSARWKHQSRIINFFDPAPPPDATLMNMSSTCASIGGKNPWGKYLSDRYIARLTANGLDGIMFDNGDVYQYEKFDMSTDYESYLTWTLPYKAATIALNQQISDDMEAAIPGVYVGKNAGSADQDRDVSLVPDWALNEEAARLDLSSSVRYSASTDGTDTGYDDYLPANNPSNTKGAIMYMDGTTSGYAGGASSQDSRDDSGAYYTWEKRNRRPILALALHLIGQNENTHFMYNAFTLNNGYSNLDQVRYHTGVETTLAAQLNANPVTGSTKTLQLTDPTGFGASNTIIQIGGTVEDHGNGEHILMTSLSGSTYTFSEAVYNTWPAGTPVYAVSLKNQSSWVDGVDDPETVCYYNIWFPAMGVDVGVPDTSGHNGGARDTAWRTGDDLGDSGATGIMRRDYTNALVFARGRRSSETAARMNTPLPATPIALGGTYYPLKASGKTGPGVTTLQLRAGEAAILMKSAIP